MPVRELPWETASTPPSSTTRCTTSTTRWRPCGSSCRTLAPAVGSTSARACGPCPGSTDERHLVAEMEQYGTLESPFDPEYLRWSVEERASSTCSSSWRSTGSWRSTPPARCGPGAPAGLPRRPRAAADEHADRDQAAGGRRSRIAGARLVPADGAGGRSAGEAPGGSGLPLRDPEHGPRVLAAPRRSRSRGHRQHRRRFCRRPAERVELPARDAARIRCRSGELRVDLVVPSRPASRDEIAGRPRARGHRLVLASRARRRAAQLD